MHAEIYSGYYYEKTPKQNFTVRRRFATDILQFTMFPAACVHARTLNDEICREADTATSTATVGQ